MSSADDAGVDVTSDAPPSPSKTLPHIDLPPPNPKDRRNSASRLSLKSLPEEYEASPDGNPSRELSPSARGRGPHDAEALEAHRKAIQSWSEEFKVQLAANGGADEEEEEQEGGGEGDFDNAEEAQALLDFAEAIEHSGEDVLKGMGVDVEALLGAHTVAGVVSGFKNAAQRSELLRVRAGLRRLEELRQDCRDKARVSVDARERHANADKSLGEMKSKIQALQAEVDELNARDRYGNLAAIKSNEKRIAQTKELVEKQEKMVAEEAEVAYLAEREKGLADADLAREESEEAELLRSEERMRQEEGHLSEYKMVRATQELQRRDHKRSTQVAALADKVAEEKAFVAKSVDAALLGRARAVERLRSKTGVIAYEAEVVMQYKQQAREKRKAALLGLRQSMVDVKDSIQGANARRAEQAAAEEKRRSEEAKKILAAAGNPHAVWRQREFEKRLDAERQRRAQARKDREKDLIVRFVAEAERRERAAHQRAIDREYEKKFQQEMGVEASHARVRHYLESRTIGGRDVIDPTGTLREIHGSQHTVLKDWSFGLGLKPRDDVINKVAAQYPDVGPIETLLPKMQAAAATKDVKTSAEAQMLAARSAAAEMHPSMNLAPFQETASVPEFAGLWAQEGAAGVEGGRRLKLTKLEVKMMEEARKKQKENIVQPQVVWGRTFKGAAFISEPSCIEIKDFDVGKSYTRTFTLTNVSFTFNSFKLLELPDAVKDFFSLKYTPPGAISAGISCPLHLTFSPLVNEDITASIPFLAETGPFSIPVSCLRKRAALRAVHPKMSFNIIFGETKTINLVIENSGALEVNFTVKEMVSETSGLPPPPLPNSDPDDQPAAPPVEFAATKNEMLTYEANGSCSGYSKSNVALHFAPTCATAFNVPLLIEFAAVAGLQPPPLRVLVACVAGDVPIYLPDDTIDMRTCLFGETYRHVVVAHNRSSTSFKAAPKIPPELRGALEFSPKMGFVQGGESFNFQIKFEPTQQLLQQCKKYLKHRDDLIRAAAAAAAEEKGEDAEAAAAAADPSALQWAHVAHEIQVPLQLDVPEQAAPVFYMLRARLSEIDIVISPSSVDFGKVVVGAGATATVAITNRCCQPQRVGVQSLPKNVSLAPNEGFLSLLPGETRSLSVTYTTPATTELDSSLTITTSLSSIIKRSLRLFGRGSDPSLALSTSSVTFAATSIGDVSSSSVNATNTTKKPLTFQIYVPADSGLFINPVVATLEAGGTVRLQIDYTPRQDAAAQQHYNLCCGVSQDTSSADTPSYPLPAQDAPLLISETFSVAPQPQQAEAEPFSFHRNWRLPVFIQGETSAAPIFIGVCLTAIAPQFTVEFDQGGASAELDMSDAPIGQEIIRIIRIKSAMLPGTPPLQITATGLDPIGPLSLVKVLRELPQGETLSISLSFKPKEEARYNETLRLQAGVCGTSIAITGRGVCPKFTLEPTTPAIDMGDVLVGEEGTAQLKLTNTVSFALQYSIVVQNIGRGNATGTQPFDAIPADAVVPQSSFKDIQVSFRPDDESLFYSCALEVVVPNQKEKSIYTLLGRCWAQAMYCRLPVTLSDALPSLLSRTLGPGAAVGAGGIDRFDPPAQAGTTKTLRLVVGDNTGAAAASEVVVGNCGAKDPGEFAFDVPADAKALGFTAEPGSGTVPAGQKASVQIKFAPPAGAGDSVGRWVEGRITCTLKKGTPAPAAADGLKVIIVARAFMSARSMGAAAPVAEAAPAKKK